MKNFFYPVPDSSKLVFGEPFEIKLQRWQVLHAVFPTFESWVRVFQNPEAGLERWGGSSRICMDWLPYMFSSYTDFVPSKNFFKSTDWKDTQHFFSPNLSLLKVQTMRKIPGRFAQYKQSLENLENKIKNHFFPAANNDISRFQNIFEKLDGRDSVPIDIHASESALPTADLKHCWMIMETALETYTFPKVRGMSGYLLTFLHGLDVAATLGEIGIGIYMVTTLSGIWFATMPSFCAPLPTIAPLNDGEFYCTSGYAEGSICWLLCGEHYVDATVQSNTPSIYTVCSNGAWSNAISCTDTGTRPPYS